MLVCLHHRVQYPHFMRSFAHFNHQLVWNNPLNNSLDAPSASSRLARSRTTLATGREKLFGHLAMMMFAILISGSFSLGSMAVPFIEPGAINTIRFIFGCVIMFSLLIFTQGKIQLPASPWRFMLLGALMGGYFVLMFVALQTASPVSTAAVFTLIPLMSAGFGYFILAQTTRPIVIISLIIAGFGAIWVIFRGDINALLGFDVGKGEMIFFAGCMLHAAYSPLVKRLNRGESVMVFTFWTLVATAFWVTLYGMNEVISTDWQTLPPIVWITIGYLTVFTTAGTFFLLQFASLRLPASKVLAYGYLTPSIIILLEGWIGHGWANMFVAFGALVTICGLIVMNLAPDS